jgi:hypothetical protein
MVVAMLAAIGVMSKKVGMQNCILLQVNVIVQNASKYAETVVVTGGEPLMWDMSLLTQNLKNVGRKFISKPQVLILYLGHGTGLSFAKKKK